MLMMIAGMRMVIIEELVAPKCGHASFNTCRICMSAYGSFSKIVQNSKVLKVTNINILKLIKFVFY